MYCVKGAWSGQTFALATTSDAGGRKTRIRRSKEERKAMAETFIKRYQSLNDGNFPSLSLTHKEVGGSFYTVRELVREIIQENRVLGPGKLISDVEKDDTFAKDYPLGSISTEPQSQMIQTGTETIAGFDHQEKSSTMLSLDSEEHLLSHEKSESIKSSNEHQTVETHESNDKLACPNPSDEDGYMPNNGQYIEGEKGDICIQNNTIYKESHELLVGGSDGQTFSEHKEVELLRPCNEELPISMEEVVVETFPLRPVTKVDENLSSTSTSSSYLNGALNKLEAGQAEAKDRRSLHGLPNAVTSYRTDGTEIQMLDRDHGVGVQRTENHAVKISHAKTSELPDQSAIRAESLAPTRDHTGKVATDGDLLSKTTESSGETIRLQMQTKVSNGTSYNTNIRGSSSKSADKSTASAGDGKFEQRYLKTMTRNSPTLDRINLESWESKKTGPLFAFFKSLVDSFVKFWSD